MNVQFQCCLDIRVSQHFANAFDIRAVFIPAEVGGVAAARQHRQRDAVPFRRLRSVQLVRLAVFLLHIRSQRRQIAVVVVLRAVAGQPDGQPA